MTLRLLPRLKTARNRTVGLGMTWDGSNSNNDVSSLNTEGLV